MAGFEDRYQKLNDEQRQAVDTIEGPVLVVAGPGAGKTELLSMRVANILRLTDALPGNILCLTFTEAAALNMKERLAGLIGPDAYKALVDLFDRQWLARGRAEGLTPSTGQLSPRQ